MTLDLASGDGGRGAVSFRREKFVPQGGPDGGDGGGGGDAILVADARTATLDGFRYRRRFRAENGRPGAGALRHGRRGADLVLRVPLGTVVRDADGGEVLADLLRDGDRLVVATGGRGGRGNARFTTATHQAPRVGELGEPGRRRRVALEMRLIADVGIVGMPNVGKSTLLAALTGAHPKIAAYPFTTLHPNLGVAVLDEGHAVVIADVPGLIEGAHRGAGLGLGFLRHVQRTRALIHVVDASLGTEAALRSLDQVSAELVAFSPELAVRPAVVAFNKIDLPGARASAAALRRHVPGHAVSAATGEGCRALLEAAASAAASAPPAPAAAPSAPEGRGGHRVYRHRPGRLGDVTVTREEGAFRVRGEAVERAVAMADLDSDEAVARLQRRLRGAGVDGALAAAGCREGDTVRIGAAEFEYRDDTVGEG